MILGPTLFPATSYAAAQEGEYGTNVAGATLEVLVDGRLAGSAWFAASQGLAITAAHVVQRGHRIEVRSTITGRLQARVLASDYAHDLALLQVERRGKLFAVLQLASHPPRTGESLTLYGAALFRHGLALPGTVAADHTMFEWNKVTNCYAEVRAVAAMTPKGLSGGAWVNSAGEVVGVQSTAMTEGGGLAGIAFMSPLKAIRKLLQEKRQSPVSTLGGVYAEAWEPSPQLGASETAETQGIRVLRVLAGSPLALAGVRPGEMLLALDGERLELRDQLIGKIRSLPPGSGHTLTFQNRKGVTRKVAVTLADLDNLTGLNRARTP